MVVETTPHYENEDAGQHAPRRKKARHPLKQEAINLEREATAIRRWLRAEVPLERIEAARSRLLKEQQRLAAELAAQNWEAVLITAETLHFLSVPDHDTLQRTIDHYQTQLGRADEFHGEHHLNKKEWRRTRNIFAEAAQQLRWVAYRSAPNRLALDMLIGFLENKVAEEKEAERAERQKQRRRWDRMPRMAQKALRWAAVFGVTVSALSVARETQAQDLQNACDTAQEAQAVLVRELNNLNSPDNVNNALTEVMAQCEAFTELDLPSLLNAAILIDPRADIVGWDENGPAMSLGKVGEFDEVTVAFQDNGVQPEMIGPWLDANDDPIFYYQVNFARGEEHGFGYLAAPEVMEHAPERFFVRAVGAGSNIRSGPGTEFERVAQTEQNQPYILLGEMPQNRMAWAEVLLPDGRTGFIRADQLEPAPLTETEIINQMPVVVRTQDGQTHTTRLRIGDLRTSGLNPLVLQGGLDWARTLAWPETVVNPTNLQFVIAVNEPWPSSAAEQETLIRNSLTQDMVVSELISNTVADRVLHESGNVFALLNTSGEQIAPDATLADIRANSIEAYVYLGVGQLIDQVFTFNASLSRGYDFGDRASFEQNHEFSLVPQRDANGVRRLNIIVDGTMVGAVLLDNFAQVGDYNAQTLVLAEPGAGDLLAENPIVMAPTAEPSATTTQTEPTPIPTEVGGIQLISIGGVSVLENQTGSFEEKTEDNETGNPLEAIRVEWPLSRENVDGVYFLPCAVSDIIFNSEINNGEGRHITPELESMLDVKCRYLAPDGTEQELLIPMSFEIDET